MACCCGPSSCGQCCAYGCPQGSAFAGKQCSDIYLDFSVTSTDVVAEGSISTLPARPCVETGSFSRSMQWSGAATPSAWNNQQTTGCQRVFLLPQDWGGTTQKSYFFSETYVDFSVRIVNGACIAALRIFSQNEWLGLFRPDDPWFGGSYGTEFRTSGTYSVTESLTEKPISCITDAAGMSISFTTTNNAQPRSAGVSPASGNFFICGTGTLGFSGGVITATLDSVSLLP